MAAVNNVPITLPDVYAALIKKLGPEIYGNPNGIVAGFSDLVPYMTDERDCLVELVKIGFPASLLSMKAGQEKEVQASGRQAAETLKANGIAQGMAVSSVEALCAGLGFNVSVGPDYSDGQTIPYDVPAFQSLENNLRCLNHIRYFLNHQDGYKLDTQNQELVADMRKKMGKASQYEQQIVSDYNTIAASLLNNPYDYCYKLDDHSDHTNFADNLDCYFVEVGNTTVPAGYIREQNASELGSLVAPSFKASAADYAQRVSDIKTSKFSGVTLPDTSRISGSINHSIFSIILSIILLGATWFLAHDYLISFFKNKMYGPALYWLRKCTFNPIGAYNHFAGNAAVQSYILVALCTIPMLIAAALTIISLLRMLFKTTGVRSEVNYANRIIRARDAFNKDTSAGIDQLDTDIQKYCSSGSEVKLPAPRDLGKSLKGLTVRAVNLTNAEIPTGGLGLLGRILMIVFLGLLIWSGQKDVLAQVPTGFDKLVNDSKYDFELIYTPGVKLDSKDMISITGSSDSSHKKDHTADKLYDYSDDTYWQEGEEGSGENKRARLDFGENYEIRYIVVKTGCWKTSKSFKKYNRPSSLMFMANEQKAFYSSLKDKQQEMVLCLTTPVTSDHLYIILKDVFKGEVDDTCINEITVYGKKAK